MKCGFLPTEYVPHDLVPFNLAMTEKQPAHKWVHFFIDDYQFERIWNTPNRYLPILKRFEGVITPDFSILLDMPLAQQIFNCYRNRVLAYWMQREGLRIVPTVGWSDKKSHDWCFDGLPCTSCISISTTGCLSSAVGRYYLRAGYAAMREELHPSKILVYGRSGDLLDAITYDSYCQQMKKRI